VAVASGRGVGVAEALALGLTEAEFELICRLHGGMPNRLELGVYSLLWSEHCAYKHSRRLLATLPTEGPGLVAGVGENAGVVDLGGGRLCAFKVESHNHPSAVEPFEGAATGVGGILRDIVAVGARPIAVLDSLRFGDPASARSRYLLDGAVRGIGHYGNSVGVPTVGGELQFDPSYERNCLINVMAIGLIEGRPPLRSAARGVGNLVVLLGARTGRDGIGGASVLASATLGEEEHDRRPSVQVSDPFEGKKLIECVLEAVEQGLVVSVQDLGAAGLSSACAEMAAKGGVGIELELDRVPLREPLEPVEIMISESQERIAVVVEEGRLAALLALCTRHEVEAAAIGSVIAEPLLRLRHRGEPVGELPLAALVEGVPRYRLRPQPPKPAQPNGAAALPEPPLAELLVRLLGAANLASRTPLFEQYDWLVQGRTAVGPGSGDAAVLALDDGSALAASIDCNPRRVAADPYRGTIATVLECAANLACVGARPLGLTNNLNFGDPTEGVVAHQLAESVRGLGEACRALGIPVVGGNVSLYNASPQGAIKPTPVVGMVGRIPPGAGWAAAGFRRAGDKVALFGPFLPTLGATELEAVVGRELGEREVPLPPPALALEALEGVREGVGAGQLQSVHDISEGGLAVAIAECCLLGGVGATIELEALATLAKQLGGGEQGWWRVLCGEGGLGFVVSGDQEGLAALSQFGPLWELGEVGGERLVLGGKSGGLERFRCDLALGDLARAWRGLAELFP